MRLAIVNSDKCKPKKCKQECKKSCPVVRMGKLCIDVNSHSVSANISEELCSGCGECVKRCPFSAVKIINVPQKLQEHTTHRYGKNSFVLYKLPIPRVGQVLGLVGSNGTGKSTILQILCGILSPNLGKISTQKVSNKDEAKNVQWTEIIHNYRGSELQNYFTNLSNGKLKVRVKPQYVDQIAEGYPDLRVGQLVTDEVAAALDLGKLAQRKIKELSGGELQRLAIGMTISKPAEVYMFDEPSSFLDIKQRLQAAKIIREQLTPTNYVICVEHDLSVLDYLSDYICLLYGEPSAYGIVSVPFSTREGINIFLSGYIPAENMRFRNYELNFKAGSTVDQQILMEQETVEPNNSSSIGKYNYPAMESNFSNSVWKKSLDNVKIKSKNGEDDSIKIPYTAATNEKAEIPNLAGVYPKDKDFILKVEAGTFQTSEIVVLLGENGTGKTTFIKMLNSYFHFKLSVSYKPQHLNPTFSGTVRELLLSKISDSYLTDTNFQSEVLTPMLIEDIIDQPIKTLSGGELQRVAIVLTLGKPAHIYLIDEPSAYLDSEQRIITSRVIKRFMMNRKRVAFIVEHDFMMSLYLADKVIVFSGEPSVNCVAHTPQNVVEGMNSFLKQLDITFRRDMHSYRPRINKKGSSKDVQQKLNGTYFYTDIDTDE